MIPLTPPPSTKAGDESDSADAYAQLIALSDPSFWGSTILQAFSMYYKTE